MSQIEQSEEWVSKILTVTKLINHFKEALSGMIPIFEKNKIIWAEGEQDEDFEGLSESLYHWLVIHKLETMVAGKFDIQPETAKYGILYNDYSKKSFIEVGTSFNEDEPGFFVFTYLKTKVEPFDTIVCNKINSYGKVIEKNVELSLSEYNFRYQYRNPQGSLTSYDNILGMYN